MSGTYHRFLATPRTVLEALAARLLCEEEIAQAMRDAEGEARDAVTADPKPPAELPPADVSKMLLDAAAKGPSSYSELRGFHDGRPERQIAGDVPADCRGRFGTYTGNGSDHEGL